jgi:hypothetical protein
MTTYEIGSASQPFPLVRPEIRVATSEDTTGPLDCGELLSWFTIPEVGEKALWAIYDPPEWSLTEVTEMHVARKARVHGVEGVEIGVRTFEPARGWLPRTDLMHARLTVDSVEWLSVLQTWENEERSVQTFLDEGFDVDWGSRPSRIEATALRSVGEGRFEHTSVTEGGAFSYSVVGTARLEVGERAFDCARVVGVDAPASEGGLLVELFFTPEGRTLLCRRYNGRLWRVSPDKPEERPWEERLPGQTELQVDGARYVHWYDCLGDGALGIEVRG